MHVAQPTVTQAQQARRLAQPPQLRQGRAQRRRQRLLLFLRLTLLTLLGIPLLRLRLRLRSPLASRAVHPYRDRRPRRDCTLTARGRTLDGVR